MKSESPTVPCFPYDDENMIDMCKAERKNESESVAMLMTTQNRTEQNRDGTDQKEQKNEPMKGMNERKGNEQRKEHTE